MVKTFRTDDFTGGLNLRDDVFHIGSNESPDLLNVDVDPRGGVSMRRGVQNYSGTYSSGGFLNGIGETLLSWRFGGQEQVLLAARAMGGVFTSETILYMNSSTLTATGLTTNANSDRLADSIFAPWDGTTPVVYVANGGVGQKWNGAAATNLTASGAAAWQESLSTPTGTHMPQGRHVATHVDRLWTAYTVEGGTTYPNRVRFSHPLFPESWRSADYIDIVGGSDGITALVPHGERLLVFKQDSVHAIYGYDTDTFTVTQLAHNLGVVNARNVAVATGSSVYFFSAARLAVFRLDPDGIFDVSEKVRDGWKSSGLLPKLFRLSWAGRKLWLGVPDSSYSTYVLDPMIETDDDAGAWTRHKFMTPSVTSVNCAIDHDVGGVQGYAFACFYQASTLRVVRLDVDAVWTDDDVGSGADTVYSSYYTTKWHDLGEVASKKMWLRPDFIVQQVSVDTTLTVDAFKDWDESQVHRTSALPILLSASADGAQLVRGSRLGLGRAMQLKVTGPGSKAWNVESITYKFNPRKVM